MKSVAFALLFVLAATVAQCEKFTVDWVAGKPLSPLEVTIGDTVEFKWTAGRHDLVEIETFGCSTDNIADGKVLADLTKSSYTFTATEPGQVFFTCSVPGHCETGQLLDIIVQTVRGGAAEGGADADGDGAADISTIAEEIPENYLDDPKFADILENGNAEGAKTPIVTASPTPEDIAAEEEAEAAAEAAEQQTAPVAEEQSASTVTPSSPASSGFRAGSIAAIAGAALAVVFLA